MKSPNCMKCKHFYVTYDTKTPKGCRFYRFISKQIPSMVVKKETGSDCIGFEPREKKKSRIDYNSNEYW